MNQFDRDDSASSEKGRPKRRHPRDMFHAYMVEGAEFDPDYDMPPLCGDPDIVEREVVGLGKGRAIAVSSRGCVKDPGDLGGDALSEQVR